MDSILQKSNQIALHEFVANWAKLAHIDVSRAGHLAESEVKYVKGNQSCRDTYFRNLEQSWYQSLDNDQPNYSIYADRFMLAHLWACWIVYSRKYLLNLKSRIALFGNVSSIVDLGCGFGYTTAALKELFPKADVAGTQLEGNIQWDVASTLGCECGFSVLPFAHYGELVFASEYFEHFEKPIEHLHDVLSVCNPRWLVIANAFGATSLGHFMNYQYRYGCSVPREKIGRLFNQELREAGYEQVKTNLWNNRPAYWRRR